MERALYADYFGIDPQRIDMIHWAVAPPEFAASERALIPGDYICAVGSQGRDYGVLVEAMKSLPGTRLVIVATKEAMRGVARLPDNVEVRASIPLRQASNIIGNCKFMVLPLLGEDVPCGHVTAVAADASEQGDRCDRIDLADYMHDGVAVWPQRRIPPRLPR